MAKFKKELENLQKEKILRNRFGIKNTNLKKFQTQLYQVKSNKEYSAINWRYKIQNLKWKKMKKNSCKNA